MGDIVDATGVSYPAMQNIQDERSGYKIYAKVNCTLIMVELIPAPNFIPDGPVALLDTDRNILSSVARSGVYATFDYPLVADTSYYIVCGLDTFSYNLTRRVQSPYASYPIVGTNINFTAGFHVHSNKSYSESDGGAANIVSVTTNVPPPIELPKNILKLQNKMGILPQIKMPLERLR